MKTKIFNKIPIIFLSIIGIFLRIFQLGQNDFWYDEAFNYFQTKCNLLILEDLQMPLYTFVLKNWLFFFNSPSEFIIRFLPFLLSIFTLYLVYKIGNNNFSSKHITTYFLILFTISPLHIWYAQENRAYVLIIFLSNLLLYRFFFFLNQPNKKNWVIFTLVMILFAYSEIFSFLIFISLLVICLWFNKKNIFYKVLFSVIVAILFLLPMLPFIYGNFSTMINPPYFWTVGIDPVAGIHTIDNFLLGYNNLPIFYILLRWTILFLILYIMFRQRLFEEEKFKILFFYWMIPFFIYFILGSITNVFLPRKCLFLYPGFVLFVGYCLSKVRMKFIRRVFLIFIIILTSISLINYYRNKMPAPDDFHYGINLKRPIEPVVKYIKNNFKSGDILGQTSPDTNFLFHYYWGKDYKSYLFYFPVLVEPFWLKVYKGYQWRESQFLPNVINLSHMSRIKGDRIWLISSSWSRDYKYKPNSYGVMEWFKKRYNLIDNYEKFGVKVMLYSKE